MWKRTSLMLILILSTGICACQPTPIKSNIAAKDYLQEYINVQADTITADTVEKHWTSTETFASGNTLCIDADVYCNAVQQVPVLSIEPHRFNSIEMEQIAHVFCPDYTICDLGDRLTKEALEQSIIELQEKIFKIKNDIPLIQNKYETIVPDFQKESAISQYQEAIDYYTTQVSDAPSRYDLPITLYKMTDYGSQGEQLNLLAFSDTKEITLDFVNRGNSSLFLLNTVSSDEVNEWLSLHLKPEINCEPDLIDLKIIVDEKVNSMGIDYMELYSIYKSDDVYRFVYTRISQNMQETYTNKYLSTTTSGHDGSANLIDLWGPEYLQIDMKNDSVIKISWYNPADVATIDNSNVRTIPWETVKGVFSRQMSYMLSSDTEARDVYITQIEFGLTKILMKNSRSDYKLIPTWSFFGYDSVRQKADNYICFLTINALDGTVIDRGLMY